MASWADEPKPPEEPDVEHRAPASSGNRQCWCGRPLRVKYNVARDTSVRVCREHGPQEIYVARGWVEYERRVRP